MPAKATKIIDIRPAIIIVIPTPCSGFGTLENLSLSRIPATATPAGLGYATANDLFKFAQAMRRNALISANTRGIMFSPKEKLNSPRYGFGFRIRSIDGCKTVGHSGGYIGINNSFSMGLEDGQTVIILSNLDIITGTVASEIGIFIQQLTKGMRG